MTLTPLLNAPILIQLHAVAALAALGLGLGILAMRKGTWSHRQAGRVWVVLMAAVALSSFRITGLGPGHYSWIHLLSVITLIGLVQALLARRRGDIKDHARGMIMIFLGLFIAGAFTLMPGRIMGAVVFGW